MGLTTRKWISVGLLILATDDGSLQSPQAGRLMVLLFASLISELGDLPAGGEAEALSRGFGFEPF